MKPRTPKGQTSQRQLRVAEEIRHALADSLHDIDFIAPELVGVSVTVSEVRTSPDLRHATAFVIPLGVNTTTGGAADAIIKTLNIHAGYFRHAVDRRVALKSSPQIKFLKDESFDYAARIESLLKDVGDETSEFG